MGRSRPAVGGSHWHSRDSVPSPGPGQRKYLCAGVPKGGYSVRLLGAKTEIPVNDIRDPRGEQRIVTERTDQGLRDVYTAFVLRCKMEIPVDSPRKGGPVKKLSIWKMVCILFVFCAATAIASPADTSITLYFFGEWDGKYPTAGLVQASDGNFYGTTSLGGDHGWGTVFKITPRGTLTILHSFDGFDGGAPEAGL